MSSTESFWISKWYMDGVSDSGEAFIGYAAELRWGRLKLGYSETLQWCAEAGARSASSLHGYSLPQLERNTLHWEVPALGVNATWAGELAAVHNVLIENETGRVDWHCHFPRAVMSCHREGAALLEGVGYVEELRLTMPPWKLPIDELYWGRFVSAGDALTWIEWRGPHPLLLMYHNGQQVHGEVQDERVVLADGQAVLSLSHRAVLREGTLGSTLFGSLSVLADLIPAPFLRTHECKWRSRGVLERFNGVCSEGWAIHEVVRFGGRGSS